MTSLLWAPSAADPIPATGPCRAAVLGVCTWPFPPKAILLWGSLLGAHHWEATAAGDAGGTARSSPGEVTPSTSKGRLSLRLCLGWSRTIPLAPGHQQAKGAVGKCRPSFALLPSERGFPVGREQTPGMMASWQELPLATSQTGLCCPLHLPARSRSPLPASAFHRCPRCRGAAGAAGARLRAGAAAVFHVSSCPPPRPGSRSLFQQVPVISG